MNLFRVLFELFVIYLLYKIIFDFIIPIFETTKQVKQKVGEMQRKMDEQLKQQQSGDRVNATAKEPAHKPDKEDYIDFEEVK